jgi:LmbE family N-acetylglucosaminyl deacetylase
MRAPWAARAVAALAAVVVALLCAAVAGPHVTSAPVAGAYPVSAPVASAARQPDPGGAASQTAGLVDVSRTATTTSAGERMTAAKPVTRAKSPFRPVTLKPGTQRLPAARDVVFIVPHADDEALFAGELLAHYRASGARIHLVYTTNSAGGEYASRWPEFQAARARVRRRVVAPLGGKVHMTTASVPDGGAIAGGLRRRRILALLRKPGVVPAGATLFAIGGTGNSDHVASLAAARAIARERRRPLYIYWGYGADGTRLDPHRSGQTVVFTPTRGERSFKRWAVSVYYDLLYKRARYLRAKPQIMGRQGDDVVTVVR